MSVYRTTGPLVLLSPLGEMVLRTLYINMYIFLPATEDSTSNIALYAGVGGGAAALLLVVGVICICRKRNQK